MLYAIIDIGSNTIRLSIFERNDLDEITLIITKKKVIGLSSYIKNHVLQEDGLILLSNTLHSFQEICQNLQVEHIHCFATGVLRPLHNINEIQQHIWNATHSTLDIISGNKEAMLDQLSNAHYHGFHNGILLDIGGSTTELAYFVNDQPRAMVTLPFGSLSLYDNYVEGILPTPEEMNTMAAVIQKEIMNLPEKFPSSLSHMIGIGGSLRSLLKIENELREGVYEGDLHIDFLEHFIFEYRNPNKEEIRRLIRLVPDRIHTVVPGSLIAYEIAKRLQCEEICISQYGIRDGYLLKLLEN